MLGDWFDVALAAIMAGDGCDMVGSNARDFIHTYVHKYILLNMCK